MLDLAWTAIFDDGKVIYQFDDVEQKREHLFKEVIDYQNKAWLICLRLTNLRTHRDYAADLVNGKFHIHNSLVSPKMFPVSFPEKEVKGTKKYKYRYILFRRVTQEMKWDGKVMSAPKQTDIQYFLGFQYKNENGDNIKRIIQISKNDEVYFA